jgi:hypothetical protein
MYALGMIYGKGEIQILRNGCCKLKFGLKFRQEKVGQKRADNQLKNEINEKNQMRVIMATFFEFQNQVQKLAGVLNVKLNEFDLEEGKNWSKKEMMLETEQIPTDSEILKELFGTDKISSETILHVPLYLFSDETPLIYIKSFLQGVCDAASLSPSESSSSHDSSGKGVPRMDIELPFSRWFIPVEITRLFQRKLKIPVVHVNWGHPNIRTPRGIGSWKNQNHQMRIYPQYFQELDFRLNFKKKELVKFLKENKKRVKRTRFSPSQRTPKIKIKNCKKHEEDHIDIPKCLRNLHFSDQKQAQIYNILKEKSYPLDSNTDFND